MMQAAVNYDLPLEWQSFSRLASQDVDSNALWCSQLTVLGMYCAGCAIKLENAVAAIEGVVSIEVSAVGSQASVVWDSRLTKPSLWMGAARHVGYELFPADSADFNSINDQNAKLALWRWLVAGFCMMQIMMYAAPQYFARPGEMSPDLQALLRWASWVLSLPILFFSSGPFFKSAFRDLRDKSIGMDLPVALGIAVTFLVSSAATFEPRGWWGEEVYFDSLSMFVFFILSGRWLEQRMRQKTANALHLIARTIVERTERKLANGAFESIAITRLALGDVIRVLPGQKFPADGSLVHGSTFVNEAFLTGESRPLGRTVGSQVMAGSYNLTSPCEVRIQRVGDATRYAQITTLMQQACLVKPRLAILADRIAKPFLILVLFAAIGAVTYWWRLDPVHGLMAAVAILIVTCPCALSLATPSAMLSASGALAANGILVRHPQGIEALSQIDTVIFDKTGTLTKKQLGVRAIYSRAGIEQADALQLAGLLAQNSLHPVAQALANQLQTQHAGTPIFSSVREISGQGLEAYLEDPGSQVACTVRPGRITLGKASFCGVRKEPSENTQAYLCDELGLVARFEFDEVLRPDTANAVALLQAYGLQVRLMSGDLRGAANKIAAELGIYEIDAECSPEKKLQLLQGLQSAGHKVLMVGDGMNDGPALSAAHVSIAMGVDVPLAQPQADFIIPSEQLRLIPILVDQAQRTMRIVRQNLAWASAYNAVGVPLALFGYLPAWLAGLGMASSSLLVILNASRLAQIKLIK